MEILVVIEDSQEIEEFISSLDEVHNAAEDMRDSLDRTIAKQEGEESSEQIVSLDDPLSGSIFTTLMKVADSESEATTGLTAFHSIHDLTILGDQIKSSLDLLDNTIEGMRSDDTIQFNEEFVKKLAISHYLSDDYVQFFSLSHIILENYTGRLLRQELIDDEYEDSNKTDDLLNRRLSQHEREQFLLRTGIIESDELSEMSRVRNIRNSLTHDIHSRQNVETEDIQKADFDRAIDIITDIQDKIQANKIEIEEN